MCSSKDANNSGFHSGLSQPWESDPMKRQNLAGIPRVMCHQGRRHLLTDCSLLQHSVDSSSVGFMLYDPHLNTSPISPYSQRAVRRRG